MAAAGALSAVPGLSSVVTSAEADAPAAESTAASVEGDLAGTGESVVAHVRDVQTGEIRLFVGERTIDYRDPALAARLVRAAK